MPPRDIDYNECYDKATEFVIAKAPLEATKLTDKTGLIHSVLHLMDGLSGMMIRIGHQMRRDQEEIALLKKRLGE